MPRLFDCRFASQISSCQRLRFRNQTVKIALIHQTPAKFTGRRADVQNVIRGANHVFVVLHHQHRVTDVAQVVKQANQTIVVARMQANRWFVQDVQRADQ